MAQVLSPPVLFGEAEGGVRGAGRGGGDRFFNWKSQGGGSPGGEGPRGREGVCSEFGNLGGGYWGGGGGLNFFFLGAEMSTTTFRQEKGAQTRTFGFGYLLVGSGSSMWRGGGQKVRYVRWFSQIFFCFWSFSTPKGGCFDQGFFSEFSSHGFRHGFCGSHGFLKYWNL